MKAPCQEIYSQSTTFDFLLMVNSYCDRVTCRLRDIFRVYGLKIAIYTHCILSRLQFILSLVYLHSFSGYCLNSEKIRT